MTGPAAYPSGTLEIQRVALVSNPAAGHGNAPHATERALRRFQELGVEVVLLQGVDEADSRRLTRFALDDERIDALVISGGDGMVSLALQEQAGSQTPLGIIPAGTGNDHAREYRLPRQDPEAAAEVVASGFFVATDLGRITPTGAGSYASGQWFGSVMASGFDSLVSDRVNTMRWPHGAFRYPVATLLEYARFSPLRFHIECQGGPDHGVVIDEDVMLAAAGNTRSYGGGMVICPLADHADGLLDLTVLNPVRLRDAPRVFPALYRGKIHTAPGVRTLRAERFQIDCTVGTVEPMTCYADGDYVAELPVTVEAVAGAGRYLVPRP